MKRNLTRRRLLAIGALVAGGRAAADLGPGAGGQPTAAQHGACRVAAGVQAGRLVVLVESRPPSAVVTIPARGAPMTVPPSFLGISTEYWTIPVWASHLSLLGARAVGDHPAQSDGAPHRRLLGRSSLPAPANDPPEWVFEIRRSWLGQVRRIVNRFGVRVILDLNLVTATPQIAVQWARAAEAALPAESVVGFEIGNEPDIYSLASRPKTHARRGRHVPACADDREGVRQVLPHLRQAAGPRGSRIPLLGPALSDPAAHLSWTSRLLRAPHADCARSPCTGIRCRPARIEDQDLPHHRADTERERHRRHGQEHQGCGPNRQASGSSGSLDRVQFRHLRRPTGSQQHIRDGTMGA